MIAEKDNKIVQTNETIFSGVQEYENFKQDVGSKTVINQSQVEQIKRNDGTIIEVDKKIFQGKVCADEITIENASEQNIFEIKSKLRKYTEYRKGDSTDDWLTYSSTW